MIFVDMNQLTTALLMGESKGKPDFNDNLIRHMIINNIRLIRNKFFKDYGEIILCYDDKKSWRKDIFPEYKENRKQLRKDSDVDWNKLFEILNKIKLELEEIFPYKVLNVENCEADDIISTLCLSLEGNHIIISSDGDFLQLQKNNNIKQYSMLHKKFLTCENPDYYLFEHILRGDSSDGIPNILSEDKSFVNKIRQKSLTTNKIKEMYKSYILCSDSVDNLENWKNSIPETINFKRNEQLIDLSLQSTSLKQQILDKYLCEPKGSRKNILQYFIDNKMKMLIDHITEF